MKGGTPLTLLVLCACGASEPPEPEITVSLRSVLISFEVQTVPLEGVQVCPMVVDLPCVSSDAKGRVVIDGVPANTELALSYRREDLYPGVRMFRTETSNPLEAAFLLPLRSTVEDRFGQAGLSPDPERGAVLYDAYSNPASPGGIAPRAEGVSAILSPPSGTAFFLNEDTDIEVEPLGTSAAGLGGFMNVDPGEVSLKFEATEGRSCSLFPGGFAWPGETEDSVRALIVPGALTFAGGTICN